MTLQFLVHGLNRFTNTKIFRFEDIQVLCKKFDEKGSSDELE